MARKSRGSKNCVVSLLLIFLLVLALVFLYKFFFGKKREFFSNKAQCQLFYWKDCGHCKNMMPEWEKLEKAYPKYTFKIEKDDISAEQISEFGIQGYPMIFIVKDGKKVKEFKGNRSFSEFEKFLKDNTEA